MEKIVFIIDQANLSGMIKKLLPDNISLSETRTDFRELLNKLFDPILLDMTKKIIIARYPRVEGFAGFCLSLEKIGYIVYNPEDELEKGDSWDDEQIRIILENDSTKDINITTVCLLSGDGTFTEPLKKLKELGKEIFVIGTGGCTNGALIEEFTFVDLETIIGEIVTITNHPEIKIGSRKKRMEKDQFPLIKISTESQIPKESMLIDAKIKPEECKKKSTTTINLPSTKNLSLKVEVIIDGKIDIIELDKFSAQMQNLMKNFPSLSININMKNID